MQVNKYNQYFCSLIDANIHREYSKTIIISLLIKKASINTNTQYYNFTDELGTFLNNIIPKPWRGYRKCVLYKILDHLIIPDINIMESKYVIISSNKSNVIVDEITVIL